MRLISRILTLIQVPLFAIGAQFLTLPSTAEELAAGSHHHFVHIDMMVLGIKFL